MPRKTVTGKVGYDNSSDIKERVTSFLGEDGIDDGNYLTWVDIDVMVGFNLIVAADMIDGAAQFGMTKKRDSYVVKIFFGDKKVSKYFDATAQGAAELKDWSEAFLKHMEEHP